MAKHSYLNAALLGAYCCVFLLATGPASTLAQSQARADPTSAELLAEAAHYQDRDEYTAALDVYRQAAALAEVQGDKRSLAHAQLGEGEVYYLQTRFVHAVAILNKSVTLSAQGGDQRTEAWVRRSLLEACCPDPSCSAAAFW